MKDTPIDVKSQILSLNLVLDREGILRVGSRFALATSLRYDERFPIILAYGCQFAKLVVSFIHQGSLHGGNALMLRLVRNNFWIVKAKTLIKATIFQCKPYVIYKKSTKHQLMGALSPPQEQNLGDHLQQLGGTLRDHMK